MAETANIAEKIAKALMWPVVEMTLCAVIVLINAPMKLSLRHISEPTRPY